MNTPAAPLPPPGSGPASGPASGPGYGPGYGPGSGLTLRSAEFRRGREQGWRQLDDMLARIERRGIGSLSAEEAQRLPLLYRAALSSLSMARTIVLDRNLLLYLENLCLRAYLAVYGPRTGMLENLAGFFCRGFPQSVRRMGPHLAVCLAALLAGVVAGWILVLQDMSYFTLLVPEELAGARGPESSAEALRQSELFAPWPGFEQAFVVFANSLFRHNAIVGILCFGLGFALGLPTLLLLLYNGLIIGAFAALHMKHGLTIDFIGWLSIHGVTELLAILLCAAAGLVLAESILFPGALPRLERLARRGRRAAGVAAGAVPLFFIAGFIEGGFRQLIAVTPGRYAFALATAVLWLYYFLQVGKTHGPEK